MFSKADLTAEISRIFLELEAAKQPKHPAWITQQVMQNHPVPEGGQADFYLFAASGYVKETVTAMIRRVKVQDAATPDAQYVLEGFGRLQKEYVVERDGDPVGVPIEKMTDDELMEKYHEIRAIGDGCYLHCEEILRYIDLRKSPKEGNS
jgi:hypothetical protein